MRWLKHMTATRQDEKIALYLHSCGPASVHEGYGFYWSLLEIVASSMEKDSHKCSVAYALTTWARLLSCHHHTVRKYLSKLAAAGLIKIVSDDPYLCATPALPSCYPDATPQPTPPVTKGVTLGYRAGSVEVIIPKLLKYRDEYTKKSRQTPEQDTDTDTNTETDNIPPPPAADAARETDGTLLFPVSVEITEAWLTRKHDEWYAGFWNHQGKQASRKAFGKRIRCLVRESGLTPDEAVSFLSNQAVFDRKRFEPSDGWAWRRNMHPATWLNGKRWEDQAQTARDPPTRTSKSDFMADVSEVIGSRLAQGKDAW